MAVIETKGGLGAIARRDWRRRGFVIGIDGFMDAGKTTLAFGLAKQLSGIRVGLDCYVEKGREAPNYIGLLRLDELRRDLKGLRAAFDFVVIDGICLLDALDAIDVSLDMFVYVKRIASRGMWHDGLHLEDFAACGESGGLADKSQLDYHLSRRPHEMASLIYQRSEV
ncbi:MAG: hypothetical protein ACTHOH_02045 [Lysobacteraceae bacterium]